MNSPLREKRKTLTQQTSHYTLGNQKAMSRKRVEQGGETHRCTDLWSLEDVIYERHAVRSVESTENA